MAAALYLHNAIFSAEPSSPPPSAVPHAHTHRLVPNRRAPHDRQLSSVSSVTLHTSTSEHSHPTEPLIHPGSSGSTVYLDLLARQPTHPSNPAARALALSLEGDPVTPRERRVLHERMVRKRLQRLRWVQRTLWVIIGGWATYTTTRYYVGAVLHPSRERQIIALVMGSCTALCLACNLVSLIITVSAPRFGWWYRPRSKHVLLQAFLRYSSSLCLLAPSLVNLVLVILWKDPSNGDNSINGRCHWDIDVVWTGLGGQCSRSPAWGFWLAGSIVRVLITAAVLIAYHAVSYKYMVTRRPSRRRHSSILRHSAASFPSTSGHTTVSSRSFRPMTTVSSSTIPVSVSTASPLADADVHASQGQRERARPGSASDSEAHTLRPSRSRIVAGDMTPSGSNVVRRIVSAQSLKSSSGPRQEAVARAWSPSSSEEDTTEDGEHHGALGYAAVPLASPGLTPPGHASGSGASAWDPIPDSELNSFAAHFRALVEQVARETDEAVVSAQDGRAQSREDQHRHRHQDEEDEEDEDDDEDGDEDEDERYNFPARYTDSGAHVMLGRTIHRMPTIESLGSHEVMSLASMGKSRTSTRSNTLSNTDGVHSRSASRANSLDAAVSLTVCVDGLAAAAAGEVGEVTPGSATSVSGSAPYWGTRSTASYHTARSDNELTGES